MIHVFGAGGHAKVVLDALQRNEPLNVRIEVRAMEDADRKDSEVLKFPIHTPEIAGSLTGVEFHVAIGLADRREALHKAGEEAGGVALTIRHPEASVSKHAEIGAGSFIAAQAVVGPSARIGRGVIVNHGAVVDHDTTVGDFTHIAPNATLGGNVKVGAHCLIGAGATLISGCTVGDGVEIGAGAVVTGKQHVPNGATWMGVPARAAPPKATAK